jgi:hypothetical protein
MADKSFREMILFSVKHESHVTIWKLLVSLYVGN